MPQSVDLHSNMAVEDPTTVAPADLIYMPIPCKVMHQVLRGALHALDAPEEGAVDYVVDASQVTSPDVLQHIVSLWEDIGKQEGPPSTVWMHCGSRTDLPMFMYAAGLSLLGHLKCQPLCICMPTQFLGVPSTTLTLRRLVRVLAETHEDVPCSISQLYTDLYQYGQIASS
jgi:hypothetical protein